MHGNSNLAGQKRRHGVSYLDELLGSIALEKVIVWKRLQPRGFAHGKTAALSWVGVNEVMSILGDVTGDGRGRKFPELDPETVGELACFPVAVIRCEVTREILRLWRYSRDAAVEGGIEVAAQIGKHMAACFVVWKATKLPVLYPVS